jgi:o-succinylbenzoate synthase
LRIERLEIDPYALRFEQPYVTARGRLERRQLVLVRLHADGAFGLGEAAPLALRGGASLEQISRELVERCGPILEGHELDPADWAAPAGECHAAGVSPQALAAVEIALLDLAGRLAERPAWSILGASQARPVRCNATLVAGERAAVAENARHWAARGFRTFKLKAGMAGDVDQARAVREAVGEGARLRLDANGAWSLDDAIARLRELAPLALELVEQPVSGLEQMAAVRRATEVPVAADESVASVAEAHEALSARACDLATVKLAKVGGIRQALAIADVLPVYLSSALDGPVGIAAAAHVAQAMPDRGLAHGLATADLFAEEIASRGVDVVDAELRVPDGPGLGVEIDEAALAGCRLPG